MSITSKLTEFAGSLCSGFILKNWPVEINQVFFEITQNREKNKFSFMII